MHKVVEAFGAAEHEEQIDVSVVWEGGCVLDGEGLAWQGRDRERRVCSLGGAGETKGISGAEEMGGCEGEFLEVVVCMCARGDVGVRLDQCCRV